MQYKNNNKEQLKTKQHAKTGVEFRFYIRVSSSCFTRYAH